MATKTTIKKAVCDKCGDVADYWYVHRRHAMYASNSCGGIYVEQNVAKEVLTGEFTFDRSYGNLVYLRHTETGRTVNIYTVDLLKVLVGRPLGALTLTESKRGNQPCWKAKEAAE